jgi:wyosine [tRNA(Phe)-imidazoG37] synthetase (radical SAM superfamily)
MRNADSKITLIEKQRVVKELKDKLILLQSKGQSPDNITFAGNGEPSIHPDFEWIINNTLELRDHYTPQSKITVLSNATMLHKKSVFEALKKVDHNVLKLDSAIQTTYESINKSLGKHSIEYIIKQIQRFESKQIIQTMLLRSNDQSNPIDNTTSQEIQALINAYQTIRPGKILLYSIDRDTPASNLEKIEADELSSIAKRMNTYGLNVEVY